ncbi:gamma-aminobutyric acid receptor subunit gamma-4 isoform X2 [Eurytemora carolleeae]|uniref:gamma-aminobutyric acid receptor subunit gamma-4 isoform X2 n=1 Tax=Eurytemora carolleeae TaxID=1294199 RepID=UPI000C78F929|nr:gamma-aminobutyric acid receptor subunit gamma-4 isoform X2 [Eurytemora carolleeae]|eukprot:XP_023323769.1 gamma-aminobutyric acid receptor subunit gamma-4-like isoform X2 [Eurytemora affinis]
MYRVQIIIFLLSLHSVLCDIPKCNHNNMGDHPFCIPSEYNKDVIPPTPDGPLEVFVDIFIFEVSKINDIALTMTFELYFDLMWEESRFVINQTSDKWGKDGSFMGSTNFVKSLWLPDIQIYKCKQFKKREIVTDVAGLIVWKDRKLLYTVSTEVVVDCPMKFSAYPLDHQRCKFLVGSYIHDNTQISFSGKFVHDIENQRAQQYMINCTELDPADKVIYWANRTYCQTGFQVDLVRRRTPVLLQVYLPSGMFVVVSWISFIVPPEVVPGRMALLVTLFLVLVNIFNSVTANAPKAEGLTAVETWVVSCIIHVFGVLAEYALILKIIQSEKRRDAKSRRSFLKALSSLNSSNSSHQTEKSNGKTIRRDLGGGGMSTNIEEIFETDQQYTNQQYADQQYTNQQYVDQQHADNVLAEKKHTELERQWKVQQRESRCVREKIQMAYERVDRLAMYLFPFFFFVFNILYWTYYLIIVNIFGLSLF